ncbi:MAG: NAD-dependent epimerase/dehydratase family protein [Candidatus Competibacteraceae bacterium]|nr:NAD-dependent epimerase/dehydratase family protein [Candidatus Competibacteraceae bacterium]
MRILIVGASDFIGRSLERHLAAIGYTVVRGLGRPERENDIRIDYSEPPQTADWAIVLKGFEAVIHCVGIVVE